MSRLIKRARLLRDPRAYLAAIFGEASIYPHVGAQHVQATIIAERALGESRCCRIVTPTQYAALCDVIDRAKAGTTPEDTDDYALDALDALGLAA